MTQLPGGGQGPPRVHLDMAPPTNIEVDTSPPQDAKDVKDHLQEWPEYAAGYGAAVTNICVTFPINKAMFRQQLHGVKAKEAVKQLRREGFNNLYRGVVSPLAQKSVSTSIMFGSFSQYTRMLKEETGLSDGKAKVLAAMLAGCTEATLCPFERVQTLMQDQGNTNTYRNTPHAFSCLWKFGFKEYYRGLSAILLRNGPSNVIFFSCRDKLRESFSEDLKNLRMLADFISGACLGAFISTVAYPINTTKTHMQKTCGGKFRSFHSVFYELLQERGPKGMFRGVHINYTRSFLSWGIINVTYEYLITNLRERTL